MWWIAAFVLTIAAIVLNCIVIHILRKKQQRKSYETILLSLSVGEIIAVPLEVVVIICIAVIKNSRHAILIFQAFSQLFSKLLSLHNLVLISVDRLWAVAAPMTYRVQATTRKLKVAITFCWICPLVITTSYTAYIITKKMHGLDILTSLNGIIATGIIVADVIFFIFYGTIITIVYSNKSSLGNTLDYQLRVFRLCMGTVMIFVISSTPFVVVNITEWNSPEWLIQLSDAMLPINSIATSLLYLYQNHQSTRQSNKARFQTTGEPMSTTKL